MRWGASAVRSSPDRDTAGSGGLRRRGTASWSSEAAGTSPASGTGAVLRGRAFGIGATAVLFAGVAFLISTRGGTPAGTIRVPGGPQGLATGDGAVWVASADDGR